MIFCLVRLFSVSIFLVAGSLHCSEIRNATYNLSDFGVFRSPREKHNGWFSCSASAGITDVGFDKYANQGPLFCGFGPVKFAELAKNYNFLNDATKNFVTEVCLNPADADAPYSYEERNSLFCGGNLQMLELNFVLAVPFDANFTIFAEAPVRFVELSGTKFMTQAGGESYFAKAVNARIDAVLEANSFEPLTPTKTMQGAGDATISLGWADRFAFNEKKSPVIAAGVGMRAGLIIPTSLINTQDHKNHLFGFPLGNNGSFGVKLQMDGQLDFKPYFSILGMVENKVFFKKDESIELKVAQSIQNINFGPKGYVTFDNGHEWKVGVLGKFGAPRIGFYISAGYSYHSKEVCQVSLTEQEREAGKIYKVINDAKPLHATNVTTATTNDVKFTNELINSNTQWSRQYAHVIHLGVQLNPQLFKYNFEFEDDEDFAVKNPNPIIELAYNYPLYGKNYIAMPVYSGGLGFGVRLKF